MALDIAIPLNRTRFPSILVFGLLLCILLGYNLYSSLPFEFVFDEILIFILQLLMLLVTLFYTSISLLSYLKIIFDKDAGLKLTETSFIDNSSIFSCGEIPWEDVLDAKLQKGFSMQFLTVRIKNPEKYIAKKNFIKRYFIENRIKKIGTPVIFPDKNLKCNLDVLLEIILEQRGKN